MLSICYNLERKCSKTETLLSTGFITLSKGFFFQEYKWVVFASCHLSIAK